MRALKQRIDQWAIRAAAKSLPCPSPDPNQGEEARQLLADAGFLRPKEVCPSVKLGTSTVTTASDKNNLVHGRLDPAGADWKKRPSVLLVHGWNAELHYLHVLPFVARALRKRGMNGVLMELPCHMQRRPARGEPMRDFISDNIPQMLIAARQAIADMNAVLVWLKAQGSPMTALWGFSLGAWLAGLHLCLSGAQDAAVLTTPVISLERAVRELEFCHPIRAALAAAPMDINPLNLEASRPSISGDRILLVQGDYDRFVPSETYDQLMRAWNLRPCQRVLESHISILVSRSATRQSIDWLRRCLVEGR
jgi:dienelactone hydrolase